MKPVEFVGQTLVLEPPAGHDNATAATKVGGLPVLFQRDDDGVISVVSCWKPTPEEIAHLAAVDQRAQRVRPLRVNVEPQGHGAAEPSAPPRNCGARR